MTSTVTSDPIGQNIAEYRADEPSPTVAEYVAAGMDQASAVEMNLADTRASQTVAWLKDNGYRITRAKGAASESRLYSQGWRPYLANRAGVIGLSVLGRWAKI